MSKLAHSQRGPSEYPERVKLARSPQTVLKEVFGYDSFRGEQQRVIDTVIAGQDAFVLMPTGGGKSLCYQIPAIVRDGIGIVVSPLISLMKDQVDALCAAGVEAAYLNSSLSTDRARAVAKELAAGEIELLYVAPERLMMPDFLETLKRMKIALFAIDEAHCVSQWGHDFRPEYVQLGEIRQHFPTVPLVALTATADEQTRKDVQARLGLNEAKVFIAGFDRPNIRYLVEAKTSKPFEQLKGFLAGMGDESSIVYCLSRKRVEDIAEKLREDQFDAAPYHAGLSSEQRSRTQERFLRDDLKIVVATVAFGMGIDKPNVRAVAHYDMPKNLEGYYQETGRAGRDGLPSDALLLYGQGDVVFARKLLSQMENAQQRQIESHKLEAMVGFAEAITCRRRVLLGYFGEELRQDCGNCDVCLKPRETYDGTEDAYRALMCVYQMGQKFGMMHAIDVLRGADTARIRQFRHEQLEMYGKGAEHSLDHWASVFRQLIHQGYLRQDIAQFSSLKLTPATRAVVKREETVTLAKPVPKEPKKARERRGRGREEGFQDEPLFQALRALRKQIADSEEVPPFVIFSDATLVDMAKKKPATLSAMLLVSGVGNHKLQKYGKRFLEAIREFGTDEE
jgi:ATP-dependent DNA helicase RecQ